MGPIQSFSTFPLAFGGASISGEGGGYGFGNISETQAKDLLNEAFDLGFRVFDSAPIYGFGLSEKRMGETFRSRRESVFFISKSGVTWHENRRVDMNNDPRVTEKMLHQSLRDFQTDYIDLYMIHWPSLNVDIRRPLEVLAKAKSNGKIKHIGLCNTHIEDLEKAMEIETIEVVQSEMNLFTPHFFSSENPQYRFPITPEQMRLNHFLGKNQIETMSWGTLEKGIISGTVTPQRQFESSDCRKSAPWWKSMDFQSRYELMEKLRPILEKEGLLGIDLAITFNLNAEYDRPLTCALVGPKNSQQLNGLVQSLKNPLHTGNLPEVKKEIYHIILSHHNQQKFKTSSR